MTNIHRAALITGCRAGSASRIIIITVRLRFEPQTHWNHGRFNEAVASEKFLREVFRPVGQQCDAKEIFLRCKIDGVTEKPRTVAVTLIAFMNYQILQ